MNFTNLYINNTNAIFLTPYLCSYEDAVFFHMYTTGHYWRSSTIISLSVLHQDKESKWIKKEWISEQESDEYDMLKILSRELEPFSHIIGFNSTSFHIPYLEQKYKAYGLISPFADKTHFDQLKEIKPIGKQLHISTKLNDLRIFLKLEEELSDIECIAASTALFQYPKILNGGFTVISSEEYTDEIMFLCKTNARFPAKIRIHDTEFYLIGAQDELKIKVKMTERQLKLYYSNYKDYDYLPEEDIVIHRSLAMTIPKNKRTKATLQNCFSYVPVTDAFLSTEASQQKYLTALLQHYMSE